MDQLTAPTFDRPFGDLSIDELNNEMANYEDQLALCDNITARAMVREDIAIVRAEMEARS